MVGVKAAQAADELRAYQNRMAKRYFQSDTTRGVISLPAYLG